MNFLKKKLKPLTTGLQHSQTNHNNSQGTNRHHHKQHHGHQRDLEEDLFDEYVIEAPPHPSELLALGVDPQEIDVNDPEKLRELYRRAKAEGKDKGANNLLLARQRQKEEIEEKKKTREEWKFFDSLTSRIEQVVKESQRNLEQLKESSAVDKLDEPEYELNLSADQVFKAPTSVKAEKVGEKDWIDFGDQEAKQRRESSEASEQAEPSGREEADEFGCPKRKLSLAGTSQVAERLLEDLGIDLRTAEEKQRAKEREREREQPSKEVAPPAAPTVAARAEVDPFDTSFVERIGQEDKSVQPTSFVDPFDTSHVKL